MRERSIIWEISDFNLETERDGSKSEVSPIIQVQRKILYGLPCS